MRTPVLRLVALSALLVTSGCARFGNLGSGLGTTFSRDLRRLAVAPSDPGAPGADRVDALGFQLDDRFPVVVYRPHTLHGLAPGIVFLPGKFAPEEQYESYARALASHGFVVAVRGRYSFFYPHEDLARDAVYLGNWLRRSGVVDPDRIGIAGHSMGGQVAIVAAQRDPMFRAVDAIDPADSGPVSTIRNVVEHVRVPLLLIGAEVAWRGWRICTPKEENYEHYFEHAPPGTLELTLRGADHVQLMDEPDAFGQQICRVGTADSIHVRTLARRATVQFFAENLQGASHVPLEWGTEATLRVRLPTAASAAARASRSTVVAN